MAANFNFFSINFYYLHIESSIEDIMVSLVIFAAVGIKLIPTLSRLISFFANLSYYNSVVDTIYRLLKLRKKNNKKDILILR